MAAPGLPLGGATAIGARRSMRDEIIDALRGAIISGELEPNRVYSAPTLAEPLGVSATPVREAMIELAKEGLVVTVRNRGFQVREPSESELDNVTELRMLLEVPTVRRITENGVTAAQIAPLRPLAEAIEKAAEDQDLIGHVSVDLEFHSRLLALSGNDELVALVRELRSRSRIYGLRALAEAGRLVASAHEHSELLDLMAAGDADGAEALMRRHIGHVRGIWANREENSEV